MTQTATWDEGRQPGRRVVVVSGFAALGVAALNVSLTGRLSLFFDVTFVVICAVAALAVRPRDFFAVGVMPPLVMLGVVTMLTFTVRAAVADPVDGAVQAVVSGLAHHAGGLLGAYFSALAVLGLRQMSARGARRSRSYA